ncbi:hypothetical protein [Xanthomonas cerealis]|nr:hypothetical protein [Xanthomonas translucens]
MRTSTEVSRLAKLWSALGQTTEQNTPLVEDAAAATLSLELQS